MHLCKSLFRQSFLVAVLAVCGCLTWTRVCSAQTTPTETPAPTASPTPIDLTAYLLAHTPQAIVQLSSAVTTASPAPTAVTSAFATTAPAPTPLPMAGQAIFSPTALSSQPEAAAVTLTYDPSRSGATVNIAPLDGGTINGTAGGAILTIAADGTVSFTFQAPTHPGYFHVITRLDDVEIALPFEVASPVATLPPTIGNATP